MTNAGLMIKIVKFFLCFTLVSVSVFANPSPSKEKIEKIKKAIVSIKSNISNSAYEDVGEFQGTGFVVSKKHGFVATNSHVAPKGTVSSYFVTFHDGREVKASLVFDDEFVDLAILKIIDKKILEEMEEVSISANEVENGDKVFIIGNTDGVGFSFSEGFVTTVDEITGQMPQSSIMISLNSAGGSSGSPIINKNLECVAVLYGGTGTHAIALKKQYLSKVLSEVIKGQSVRRHIGIISDLTSLDQAKRAGLIPRKAFADYVKKFPNSKNKILVIKDIIKSTPAEKFLETGDIIMKANGAEISANLLTLDMLMDNSEKILNLEIFRNGKLKKISLPTYDLNHSKINKFVEFAGASFFEANNYYSYMSGIELGAVSMGQISANSVFSKLIRRSVQAIDDFVPVKIISINGHKIGNLQEFINVIAKHRKSQYLNIKYANRFPEHIYFGQTPVMPETEKFVTLHLGDIKKSFEIFELDEKKNWQKTVK